MVSANYDSRKLCNFTISLYMGMCDMCVCDVSVCVCEQSLYRGIYLVSDRMTIDDLFFNLQNEWYAL